MSEPHEGWHQQSAHSKRRWNRQPHHPFAAADDDQALTMHFIDGYWRGGWMPVSDGLDEGKPSVRTEREPCAADQQATSRKRPCREAVTEMLASMFANPNIMQEYRTPAGAMGRLGYSTLTLLPNGRASSGGPRRSHEVEPVDGPSAPTPGWTARNHP